MVKQKTPSTSGQEMVKGEKEGIPPTSGSQGSRAVYVVVLLGVGVAVAGVVLRALDLSRENIQLVAAAKLEKEGLGEEMRVLREDLVQEQSVNSLIREENSEQVKVLEEQEARLVGLEQELDRSKEREAALTLAKTKCGEREREVEKSHKETIGGLNKEMKTQAKDFIKQKKQKDQLLKLNVEKETEIEQLKGWLDREMESQAEDIKKQKTLNDQLLHKLKGAFEKASKEKAELLEAAKVEKEGITTEKQEEVRSILNIVAEKEAEISASKTAFLQKSEELVVLNASNQELRSALDTFKTQMEAQTKAVEAEKSTASKVSEELRAEQEVRQSAEAQVASLVEEKSSLEAGVLQAQGDVGLCLADRAREVREAAEARDSLQEECAEKARAAQAKEAAGAAARLAAAEIAEEQCREELQVAGGAAAELAAAESTREQCRQELQEAGGAAAKLAAVVSGREQCREELSRVGSELETVKGEVETVKQRLVGCEA